MKKIILYFILLSIVLILFSYFHFYFLDYKELQSNEFSKILTPQQFSKFKTNSNKFECLNLIKIPINLLVKILCISFMLFVVSFLVNLSLNYKKLLLTVLVAELVFLGPILHEIIYFRFFNSSYTIQEINYFSSLSLLNLIGYRNVEIWFIYPLQIANLFEILYCFVLFYLLVKFNNISKKESLKLVLLGYVPALLLWVSLITFLILNKS